MAPKVRASSGVILPARHRPRRGARHARVDIGVVPHVERASGAGAHGNAEERGDGEHRMHVARRCDEPDQRGEHHEEHHPRLHQREIFGDLAAFGGGQDFGLASRLTSVMRHSLKNGEGREPSSGSRPAPMTMRFRRSSSFDARQRFIGVEGRRRRQRPFERRGAHAPRIGRRVHLLGEGVDDAEQEHQQARQTPM